MRIMNTQTRKRGRFAVSLLMLVVMLMTGATTVFAENGAYPEEHYGGWLSIFNQSGATDAPMADSFFAVLRQYDEQTVAVFTTDEQGRMEAIPLPPGDYILEQQQVQQGYYLIPRLFFAIADGMRVDKTVFNHPMTPPEPITPFLTIANNPAGVMPVGQTESGYRQAGSRLIIVPGYAEGWQFIGWSIEGMMQHSEFLSLSFTMPDMDLTVKANWIENEQPDPPYEPEPPPEPQPMGRVLITKRAQGTGRLLPGAVFEIRRHIDDAFVASVITDHFGEAAIDLPVGDFFIREIIAPEGFVLNPTRIPLRITQGVVTTINVTNAPVPEPTTPPDTGNGNNQHGRLLVTSRAHGTGDLLRGAIFEVRRTMDDMFMAQIVTNQFGEASVNLPTGDFFLRELSPPAGFRPNSARVSVRIQADRMTEINVTHQPVEQEAETPAPQGYGRLLIINRAQAPGTGGRGQAQGTGAVLSNALFEVRSIMDDRLITQLQTNQFGEAAADIPPGDYYIRQIIPAVGFVLDPARTNIRIVSGELLTVTVVSTLHEVEDEPIAETPAEGRLLVTLMSSATGGRLSNGTVTIHNIMTDALVATLTTDLFGEASLFLPAGRYFMRQSSMPTGYIPNLDRIPFTINAGDITDMALAVRAEPVPEPTPTPTPPPAQQAPPPVVIETIPEPDTQSRIEIVTRAAGSGNPLSGGLFAVYRAYDSRRLGELTTDADGRAYFVAEPGMYFVRELRPTFGFMLESQRIFLEVGEGETVTMELTKERDWSIEYLPPDVEGGGIIYIPQTGQGWSTFHYVSGGIMMLISVVGAVVLGVLIFRARMRD